MKESAMFALPKLPGNIVTRDRLRKAIRAAAREGKWVALTAAGGHGKTVAVAQSLMSGQGTCAWLTVTRTDSDPAVFYGRFAAASACARGDADAETGVMPLDAALRFLRALAPARYKGWLVLDDIHLLAHEARFALPLLLMSLPVGVTPLVLGRSALPSSFGPMLKENRVVTLDAHTLAFTAEEAANLYAAAGREISGEEADAVVGKTRGLAVRLQVMALAARNPTTPVLSNGGAEPFETGMNEFIEKSIWQSWDMDTRRVLLCCASIDTLTPALCDHLTGDDDAGEILRRAASECVFFIRSGPDAWSCHDIFKDFLAAKQKRELPEDEIRRLRGLLAGWLEAKKDYYAAMGEYVTLRDLGGVHRCLDAVSRYTKNQPVESEMRFAYDHIIGKLPDASIKQSPHLLATRTWAAFLAGDAKDFLRWQKILDKELPRVTQAYPDAIELLGFVKSLDFRVPLREITARTEQALAGRPPGEPEAWDGKTASVGSVTQNLPLFHRSMRDYSEYHELRDADLAALGNTFGQMIGPEYAVMERCLVGGILYEQGDLLGAAQQAFLARGGLHGGSGAETVMMAQMLTVSVLLAMGARQQARQVLAETSVLLRRAKAEHLEANVRAVATRLRIEEGSPAEARHWLTFFPPAPDVPLPFYRMAWHFTTLSAHIALRDRQKAERFGEELLALAESYRRPLDELETLILLAVNAQRGRDGEKAMEYAGRAVPIAAIHGYTRMLKDYWGDLSPVFKALVKEDKLPGRKSGPFLKGLIEAWDVPEKPSLSAQQRVILLDLRDGYSYEAIASRLDVSKSTVKTQIGRMYKTLHVKNARDAADKAEAFALLSESD